MDNAQQVRRLHPQHDDGEPGRELATRANATIAPRSVAREGSAEWAVSRSSYLNEKDRHYRAVETVENGADLAERSVSRILRIDARLREAEEEGASPRALAAIEQIEAVFGQSTGMLVLDYMQRPYERW